MREGLRSSTRLGKGSGSGRVVHKKKVGVKNEASVLGCEGLGQLDLSTEKKGEVESAVKELNLDLNVTASENVDLAENGNSSCLVDADRKLDKGLTGVRVLRSSLKSGNDKRSSDGENDGLFSASKRGVDKSSYDGGIDVVISGSKREDDKRSSYIGEDDGLFTGSKRGDDKMSCDGENDGVFSGSKSGDDKRSYDGVSSGKVHGGGGDVHREEGGLKNETLVTGGDGLGAPNLSAEKGEVECSVKRECVLDLNVCPGGDVDLAENVNDMGCLVDASADRNANKGSIGVRVLRSRSKRGDDKRSNNGENDGMLSGSEREGAKRSYDGENVGTSSGNNGRCAGFERIKVEVNDEADEPLTNGNEKERVKVKKVGNVKRKVKGKRGRPRKTELKEQDRLVAQAPRKRGRPPKIEIEEQDQLVDQSTRKRGRSPKTESKEQDQLVDQSLRKRLRPPKTEPKEQVYLADKSLHKRGRPPKGVHKKKCKPGFREGKGLIIRDSANMNAIDGTCSRRSPGKKLKGKGISYGKKNKLGKVLKAENDGVASPLKNTDNGPVSAKREKSIAKQLVRDQIMERLSAAGWTVDYRPRYGRPYNDSVYVSPDGKTHWSITLAYKRLKEHYEAGDGEGMVYKPGFKFTPIPDEDFNKLTKVINKKRNDSNKKRKVKGVSYGGKGGKTVDGFNRKVKKVKPGSDAGMGKSVKGKMKRKHSLLNKTPVLVRDHKRHKTQNKKRCALLVRNAKEEVDSETDGYVPYSGKRTVLAWMIDLGTILQNGKVHYIQNRLKVASLEGKITGDGIHCGCCNGVVTISDFGAHAGSKDSVHLENIYTEEGTSLLHGLLDSWNKQDESERKGFHFVDVAGEDPNDDTCGVCGDGGDLICCDGCPSTFHQSCLDIEKFPSGDWHCIYCCCKFCGLVGRNSKSNQRDVDDDFAIPALLTCHLCEQKFHMSCIEADGVKTDVSRDAFFCGNKCRELSEKLEVLLGDKHELGDGFSWSFIRRSDVGFDASQIKPKMVESNSKLAVALSVMNECFMPFIDHRSGINLLRSILYNCGSNFKRLNYSGFVTAILERGDEIICAASIRIHGNQLAEMPFIGTRYMYRRQGMCRRLLNAIESALGSLNVELLVIPAISELRETWTSVFGFQPLELTNTQMTRNLNLLVFPHVDMLQKKISKHKFASENMIPTEGHFVGALLDIAENCSDEVNVSNKVVSNDDSSSGEAVLPSDVLTHLESENVTNDLVVSCELDSGVVSVPNADGVELCDAKTAFLQTDINPGDCQSIPVSSDICEKIADGANENNKTSRVAEANFFPVPITELIPNNPGLNSSSELAEPDLQVGTGTELIPNNPGTNLSSELADPDLQVGKTAQSNDSSLWAPNTASAALHWESASTNSCSSTEGCGPKEGHAGFANGCGSHSRPNDDSSSGEAVLPNNILMNLEIQNVTKDLLVNCEKVSGVADEAELCYAKTGDLQTNINSGDCQSILVSSDICEKIADAADESNKTSGVAEANFFPATITELIPNNPGKNSFSELAEPDLQVDQTARSNALPSWASNTASGATLHRASAGTTSCSSSTEGCGPKEVHAGFVNGCGPHSRANDDSSSGEAVLLNNDLIHLEPQNGTKDLRVSCEKDSVVSVPSADETKEVHAGFVNGCVPHSRANDDSSSGEAVLLNNDLIHLEPQNGTKDIRVSCEKDSVVSVPSADEAKFCYAKTADLQTNINPGDCQSILVSSDISEKIADGANESNKTSSVAEADFLPAASTELSPNNPCMKSSSELAEPNLPVDQTAQDNASPSGAPNTASGVSPHLTSAGTTSCSRTELSPNNPCMKSSSELAEPNLPVDQTAQDNASPSGAPNTASGVAPHLTSAGTTSCSRTELSPNNPCMKSSSELAEPNLPVDQTAQDNASPSWAPNTASGVPPHLTSAGTTSCSSTEGIVLSNQST